MTTTQTTTYTATITTQCLCKECPNCAQEQGAWIGKETNCYICGAEFELSDYCHEDVEDDWRDVEENLFDPWRDHLQGEKFIIEGSGVTWQNVSGSTGLMTSFNEVREFLTGNFDYTLVFTYDTAKRTLSVRRSSHDEPTGAYFELVTPDIDWIENAYGRGYGEIINLHRWSTNYDYPTPFSLFLDIIGYSEEYFVERLCRDQLPSMGYMECDYLGAALRDFALSPHTGETVIGLLLALE